MHDLNSARKRKVGMFLPNKWASRLVILMIHFANFRICFTGRIGTPWFGEEESASGVWDAQDSNFSPSGPGGGVCPLPSATPSLLAFFFIRFLALSACVVLNFLFPRFIFLVWPLLFVSSFVGRGVGG